MSSSKSAGRPRSASSANRRSAAVCISGPKNARPLPPRCFAAYIARSALRSISSSPPPVAIPQLAPVEHERLADRVEEPSRERLERRLIRDGREDRELVAADARDEVAVAKARADPLRELDQHTVAGAVAEAVVDRLEVVEVEEEQ